MLYNCFPLYPTTEKNLFRCIPKWKKISSVVSHNGGKYLPLWDTMEENLRRCGIQCGRFFWDTVHCIRFCCGEGYSGRMISCVVGYNRKKLFAMLRLFSVVSHNGKNPLLLYPTTEENLLRCIPQRKKTLLLYPTTEKNLFRFIQQWQKKVKLEWLYEKMEAKNLVILSL